MCEVELCDRVEIGRTDRCRRGDTDAFAIVPDFAYTFSEELTIPLSYIFEVFREEKVLEDISSCIISSPEGFCDDGARV